MADLVKPTDFAAQHFSHGRKPKPRPTKEQIEAAGAALEAPAGDPYKDVFEAGIAAVTADPETHAQARFSRDPQQQKEARRELSRQTRAAVQKKQAEAARRTTAGEFQARLEQIRVAPSEVLDRVESSAWFHDLSLEQREQVDDAIVDAMVREAGVEQPAAEEPTELPDLDEELDPSYEAWLNDESGFMPHPTDGYEEEEDDLLDDPVLAADAAELADLLDEGEAP
jgi:hypothetical protein